MLLTFSSITKAVSKLTVFYNSFLDCV